MAGVSISVLVGDNSILQKSKDAKELTNKSSAKERIQLEIVGSYDNNGNLVAKDLIDNIKAHIPEAIIVGENFPISITISNNEFEIQDNGNIIENEDVTPSDFMPIMRGVTHYFDSNNIGDGVTEKWENRINTSKSATLIGAVYNETEKAVEILGNSDSIGKIENIETGDRTLYCIFKSPYSTTNSFGFKYVFGATSGNMVDTIATGLLISATYNNNNYILAQIYQENDVYSNITSNNYHVVILSYNDTNQIAKFYVDGNFIGQRTLPRKNDVSTIYFGRFGEWAAWAKSKIFYRFAAVTNVEHSSDEIKENSEWLINKFINN